MIAGPRIVFDNTWRGTGMQTYDFPSRPQKLDIKSVVSRKSNRVETGRTQTVFFHRREVLEMEFNFLRDNYPNVYGSHVGPLLELWESTLARESFTLYVHGDHASAYPWSESLLIRQPLTVRWAEGYDELQKVRTEGVRSLWSLKFSFECEDGSFFAAP